MAKLERVTITLPAEIVEAIDRVESNRSRFVLDAVRQELDRRRREKLRLSLAAPHAEAEEIAELGFDDWAEDVLAEDAAGLLDAATGTPVRWSPGEGWVTRDEKKAPAPERMGSTKRRAKRPRNETRK